jgi:hypothetical protein
MDVRTVDRQRFEAVMRLLVDHPELDVDRVRGLVEGPAPARRSRRELIRPRTAAELVSLVQAGLLSKAEAKRYLDVPRSRARRAS